MRRASSYCSLLALCAALWGAPPALAADASGQPVWVPTDEGVRILPFMTLDVSGFFRFRAGFFANPALGNATAGFYHEYDTTTSARRNLFLGRNCAGGVGTDCGPTDRLDTSGSANLLFRLHPTLTIDERVRIHAEFDVLHNLVLGSTPAVHPYYTNGLAFLSESQASPESAVNALRDAVRVRRLWAELTLIDRVLLSVGRMPDHWGLGLLRNAGDGVDNDFGDSADRIEGAVRIYDMYVGFAWDYPLSGPTSDVPAQPLGQPYDALDIDDVQQYVVKIYFKPMFPDEREARERRLNAGGVGVDWGIYNAFRIQDYTSLDASMDEPPKTYCDEAAVARDDWQCYVTGPRRAFFWIPDVWLRLEWRPTFGESVRIEFESALLFGDLTLVDYQTRETHARDFIEWGSAIEFEYRRFNWRFGADFGLAGLPTGDDADGLFGVQDGVNFVPPAGAESGTLYRRNDIHSFRFNRAYQIDSFMFREVVGAVTNAWYLKPWVEWNFWHRDAHALAVRTDLLYAGAMDKRGTPGRGWALGLEWDLRLQYTLGTHFDARLESALFIPFDAFRRLDPTEVAAEPAFSLQGKLFWTF